MSEFKQGARLPLLHNSMGSALSWFGGEPGGFGGAESGKVTLALAVPQDSVSTYEGMHVG